MKTRVSSQTSLATGGRRLRVVGLFLALTAATAAAAPHDAPLDTLHVVAPPSPYESADASMGLSRTLLPDIAATSVPRVRPPQSPPRLDDPLADEYQFLAARRAAGAGQSVDAVLATGSTASRIQWWQLGQALQRLDPAGVIWTLPRSFHTASREALAAPRLLLLGHQAALVFVGLLWTVFAVTYFLVNWRFLAHDLAARFLRDHRSRVPRWLPLLWLLLLVVVRPGWFGALALISIPLLIQVRGVARAPLLAVWFVALGLLFPNWTLLREATVVLDPQSETVVLQRAVTEQTDAALMADLRARLERAETPVRRARLQIALATQEARRGRFTASNDLLREALAVMPDHVPAIVATANNAYFQSRNDDAVAAYRRARDLAPTAGEIPFNLAQVYFKKLFVPEAGQALEEARRLGFEPPPWHAETASAFSPVIYLGFTRDDLRAAARLEAADYPPLAHLAAWNALLGAPPLPPFLLLGGLLAVALLLSSWRTHLDDTRVCENCGEEICGDCCLRRDGLALCHGCGDTAVRARSGLVLATLLKNRSRSAGLARGAEIGRLARWVPGAGHLAIGATGRAVCRMFGLAVALFLLTAAWAFDPACAWRTPGLVLAEETVHPLWLPLPAASWPGFVAWPVGAGAVLLLLIQLGALLDAGTLRQKLPELLMQEPSGGRR